MSNISLGKLLEGTSLTPLSGAHCDWQESEVLHLTDDSRQVRAGTLFFAISGEKSDGHKFIGSAVAQGALAVVCQLEHPDETSWLELGIPVLLVDDPRAALSRAASIFYRRPSDSLLTIGVTGTNGKTSVTWIVSHLLSHLRGPSAMLGTLGARVVADDESKVEPLSFRKTITTTPHPLLIQEFLASALHSGATSAVLEATSQGLVQKRTVAISWDGAVFTNLSWDHLDLHGSMENYAAIKTELFTRELKLSSKRQKKAVLNIDDPQGRRIFSQLKSSLPEISCTTFSCESPNADVYLLEQRGDIRRSFIRASVFGRDLQMESRLLGRYNVANMLSALAILAALGFEPEELALHVAKVPPVPGRLELVADSEVHCFVDYSHTADALLNAQQSLRELGSGRLITVFGCGGDRDRGKRPAMGEAVAQLSDYAVVTSDNPRNEDPEKIIEDIQPGLKTADAAKGFSWVNICDRKAAIDQAISLAKPGDIVLVAGKGHENYQDIKGVKRPFLDSDVCYQVMRDRGLI